MPLLLVATPLLLVVMPLCLSLADTMHMPLCNTELSCLDKQRTVHHEEQNLSQVWNPLGVKTRMLLLWGAKPAAEGLELLQLTF